MADGGVYRAVASRSHRRWSRLLARCSLLALAQMPAVAWAGAPVLPRPAPPFAGRITPGYQDAVPAFPPPVKAPAGAPNVLLVMTDDVGFGSAGTFGGPVPTPNLDRLAARGLLYNRFHTTAMCSPTRAALLTGRNHHAVANGTVADLATGFPGYWNIMPKSAATVAEVLKDNGYDTAMFGKHHSVPEWERWPSGPFDDWPLGLGFEQFYGFVGGDTDQFAPKLYRGNAPAPQKYDADKDYILDRDLADEAIRYLHNQQAATPDKPFFLYYATGSAHAPHQAPQVWIDRFKGRFDIGWDAVRSETLQRQIAKRIAPAGTVSTPRLAAIPAWDSLTAGQKAVAARMMEAFAGQLAYQDAQIGRLLDEIERMGLTENTLVIFIEGDNGASAEGGMMGSTNELGTLANGIAESPEYLHAMRDRLGGRDDYGNYPVGWAWAMNAPMPWFKQIASHLGGTRNGLVISWPAGIHGTGVRPQFAHVTDIMPTILAAAHVAPPFEVNGVRQQPLDGVPLEYSFDTPNAPGEHHTQYFEMIGSRAIYHDGWLANTTPPRVPWKLANSPIAPGDYSWELYDLDADFAQAHDLAARYPERLKAMQALFDQEAKRNQVYPLDDRQTTARAMQHVAMSPPRAHYTYWGKDITVPLPQSPPINGRSFHLDVDVTLGHGQGNGPLVAEGSRFGGWSFFLDHGRPAVRMAASQQAADQWQVEGRKPLPPGASHLRYDFAYDGGGFYKSGTMTISVGGAVVASGRIGRTILVPAGLGETFDVGDDTGVTVLDYPGSHAFDGTIARVDVAVDLGRPVTPPPAAP